MAYSLKSRLKPILLATSAFLLVAQVATAAEVTSVERAPSGVLMHVLINEGSLHGYEKGKTVCVISDDDVEVVCPKIVQVSEFYSLIVVSSKIAAAIKPGMLVKPQDFAVKVSSPFIRSSGNQFVSTRRFRLAVSALQYLVNDTVYNRVGFRQINGDGGRLSTWGHRSSEAKANGYVMTVTYHMSESALLNLGVRSLGPMSEDLSDRYDNSSNDVVQSRTEFTAIGMSAAYGYKRALRSWLALEYSAGLDVNATSVAFKSYRSGTRNQLLGQAMSRKTFLGVVVDSQILVPYQSFAGQLGLTGILPVAALRSSYEEEVDDIDDAPAASYIKNDLGHDKAAFGFSLRLGLSASI